MRTRASLIALAVLVAGACVLLGPTAQAGPAFRLRVDHQVLRSGQGLTATATATTACDWVLEWNGTRHVAHGRTSSATWAAPQVTRPARMPLHATCFYASPSRARQHAPATTGGASQRLTVTVPPSWRHTIVVTVLPPGTEVSAPGSGGGSGHPGGGLPGTGGPALWALLAGLGAVLVGSAAVRRVRLPRALPAR